MDMYEKHLDERREIKLKMLKEVRQEIMEEQQQSMARTSQYQKASHMHSSVLSEQGVLINQHEREQMIIDKMKRRQENQVNTILSQEKRKSDIQNHMHLKEKKVQDNLNAIKKERNERYQRSQQKEAYAMQCIEKQRMKEQQEAQAHQQMEAEKEASRCKHMTALERQAEQEKNQKH